MRIEHLEYFTKVVECRSITTAASQLFISPQGLSQAIKQLEKELDIDFFIRGNNNFSLSPGGQLFYDYALKILAVNDDLRISINQLKSSQNSFSERFNIYIPHMMANTFLPPALISFHKKYPNIGARIIERNSMEVLDNPTGREASITLFSLPQHLFLQVQEAHPDIDFQLIDTAPLLALVSRRSPLTRKKLLSFDEILRHPLVLYTSDHLTLKDLFRIDLEQANIIITSPNIETCRTVLANDDNAIGFTNALVEPFFDQANALTTRPIDPHFDFVFGYFQTNPGDLPAESDDFLNILLKIMKH